MESIYVEHRRNTLNERAQLPVLVGENNDLTLSWRIMIAVTIHDAFGCPIGTGIVPGTYRANRYRISNIKHAITRYLTDVGLIIYTSLGDKSINRVQF